jgi:lysophosphatidic acid phosphatase type 6
VDTLECGRFHGDMLPPGISDDQITEVRRLLARDYALTFQDREILQLAVGRLVRELMDAMSECGTIPTLFLYSGHDATIMPLSGTSFSVLLLMKSLSW